MVVYVYGDAVLNSTCHMLSRKSTDSVVVWGASCTEDHIDLAVVRGNLTAMEYIKQILLHHVLPAAYGSGPEFLLMHDNARAHVAASSWMSCKGWKFKLWNGQQ